MTASRSNTSWCGRPSGPVTVVTSRWAMEFTHYRWVLVKVGSL